MQQLQSITTEQSEQAAQTFSVVLPETVMPSETAETNAVQQEQAATVANLLASLERDTKKRQKWSKRISIISATLFLLMLVIGFIQEYLNHRNWFGLVQLGNLFNFGSCAVAKFFLNRNVAMEVTKVDDVRCVGALVDIWNSPDKIDYPAHVCEQARTSLIRLLPRLQAGDAPLLIEAQRAQLRKVLASAGNNYSFKDFNTQFVVAILNAFARIGDWKSLPQVQKLVVAENPSPVRVAARQCLTILEALAEKQKPGETLLRASSAGEAASVSPETLLRPATPQPETDPDTLLRPSGEN